jgi:xylan 1,4-beta-xylosidase
MVKNHSKPEHFSLSKLLFLASVFVGFIFFNLYKRRNVNFKPAIKSFACFDYFLYKSEDDYYLQNPLIGINYFRNTILSVCSSYQSIYQEDENYSIVTSVFSFLFEVSLFNSMNLVYLKQEGYKTVRKLQLTLSNNLFPKDSIKYQ